MKQKFAKFMYGRYGSDELSRFLTYLGIILLILSVLLSFLGQTVRSAIFILAILTVILVYVRTFSKSFEKRRAENAAFLKLKYRLKDRFKLNHDMWSQRKEYKFFKCPSCKAVLRVPRGKGKLRVVCKKCGTAFEKKT